MTPSQIKDHIKKTISKNDFLKIVKEKNILTERRFEMLGMFLDDKRNVDLAKHYNISQERIRQLRNKILGILHEKLEEDLLKAVGIC